MLKGMGRSMDASFRRGHGERDAGRQTAIYHGGAPRRKGGDALRWARRSVPGPKWPKWAVCSATAVVILAVFSLACIALEEARPRVEGGKKKAAGKRAKKKNKGKKRKKTSKADRRRRKEERRRRDARARRNGAVSGGRRSRRRGD